MHQFLGLGDVATLECRHDRAVFCQRLLQTAFERQRVQARELQHLAQVMDHREQPAVAGEFLDAPMERLVRVEEGFNATLAGGILELIVDRPQLRDVGRPGLAQGVRRAAALEQRHQRENVVKILARNLGHVAAAARLQFDETFGGQHLERLAQRRARNPVLLGESLLVDPGAGGEFVGENALAQALGDFLVKRGRCNAGHGDGRSGRASRNALTCLHNYGYSIMRVLRCQVCHSAA